jgi:hypothetical protein
MANFKLKKINFYHNFLNVPLDMPFLDIMPFEILDLFFC